MVEGKNFIELQGLLKYPEFKETTNGYKLFKGRIDVPFTFVDKQTQEERQGSNFFNIIAWGDLAEDLGNYREGTPMLVQGVLQTKGYDSNCKSCAEPLKRYWTDIVVDNFVVVE